MADYLLYIQHALINTDFTFNLHCVGYVFYLCHLL